MIAALVLAAAAWSTVSYTDPVDDSFKTSVNITAAENTLAISCVDETVQVAVRSGEYLGDRPSERAVIYRFDDAEPVETRWHYQASRVAVTYDPGPVRDILRRIRRAKVLHVRLYDTRGNQHTASFELPLDSAPLEDVLAVCGEKLD